MTDHPLLAAIDRLAAIETPAMRWLHMAAANARARRGHPPAEAGPASTKPAAEDEKSR